MNYNDVIDFVKKIHKGKSVINLSEPYFFGNEIKYVTDAINSTYVSSVGKYVNEVESRTAKLLNVKSSVAVVNGTNALQIALKLAGVKQQDEVITQSVSFVATANAITYLNAKPIFIDVDLDTFGLCPDSLHKFLKEECILKSEGTFNKKTGKRIRACIPMHTFGFVNNIEKIIKICNDWKIKVVEDAAEAFGSSKKGKYAGTFGDFGIFSFNGNKIITSGGGGIIVTNNKEDGQKAKYLTTTAKISHKWEYIHDEIGYNFRMPNINAALLVAQLENFEKIRDLKRKLFNKYLDFFKDKNIILKEPPNEVYWNYWLFTIQLSSFKERNNFLEKCHKSGIRSRPVWRLLYKLPMFKDCQRDDQKNSIFLESTLVNLPSTDSI